MLKLGSFVAMLPSMVLCATLGRLAAEDQLARGTRAVALHLSKDQEFPLHDLLPGRTVDIVGEMSKPIKTGVALLNVKLLAVDSRRSEEDKGPWAVTVQLTPAQVEVLALMQKHAMKLGMRLSENEKRKQKGKHKGAADSH